MEHKQTDEALKNLPLSTSESVYNAYYLRGCEVVDRSPSYTSCLSKIKAVKNGHPMTFCEECNAAIRKGICDATGMRQKEELAGIALFFQPSRSYRGTRITNLTPEDELPVALTNDRRVAHVSTDPRAANYQGRHNEYIPQFKGATAGVEAKKGAKVSAPKSTGKPADPFASGGYEDAINEAVRELAVEPVAPKIEPVLVKQEPEAPKQPMERIVMMTGESPLQYARRVAALRQAQEPQTI
jgi:hypothetical protein